MKHDIWENVYRPLDSETYTVIQKYNEATEALGQLRGAELIEQELNWFKRYALGKGFTIDIHDFKYE